MLRDDEAEVRSAFAVADEKSRRESRTRPLVGSVLTLWRGNPLRRFWKLPEGHVRYRFPFTAGLLSLVPGLGQLYNRQLGKAVVVAGAWWLGIAVAVLTIREPYSNFLLIPLLLGWLLIWNDGIASAVRINGELWSFRNSVALWFAAMFAAGVLITGLQFMGRNHLSLVRLLSPVHEPDLRAGDLILTNEMAYWFAAPELGEVVYFDPARFSAEQTSSQLINDAVSLNIKNYYQRVAGGPGDRIEKKDGRIWRNGVLLARELEPFGAERIPDGQSFDVPPGHYWLPVTGIPVDALGRIFDAPQLQLFQTGWAFKGWREAALVPRESIRGKAVAVANPPARRVWLTRQHP